MSWPQSVSRADLLRLLAAYPDARLDMAARLTGCQPEEAASAYERHPAEAAEPASPVRFWHLRRRERIQASRIGAEHVQKLWQFRPLSAQELHWPDSAVPVPPLARRAGRPALTKLVNAAARLRPLPQQPKRRSPSTVPAFAQFKVGQLTIDWLELQTIRLVRAWFARQHDADLIRAARALLTLMPDKKDDWRQHERHFSLLHAIAHWEVLRQGAVLPEKCRPETVLHVIQEPQPPATWLLIQEGEELFLLNSPEQGVCLLKGSQIAVLTLTGDMLLLIKEGRIETKPAQTAVPLCSLRGLRQLCLQTTQEKLHIQTCVRPAWATLIGRNSQELFAELPWLGRSCRLRWQPPAEGEGRWFSAHGPVATDAFGLFAHLGFHGKVMQRFRWLEPGRFLMGSPTYEPEREVWGKETLHEALLSKGFWLAETAVSQELWQFVMRGNPAKFQGGGHPVDSVSWDDAQHFLERLNAMVPGLAARLPTEAEWEYACRAGTATPFAFGAQITPDLVNYNGACPYQGGAKGLFRKRTVTVGSLPANAWGLREMHGNLWEWCQDFWRNDLGCEAVVDPHGPESGEFCVVRGGSWFLAGKGVRSAARGRFAPDFRSDRVGFRIACDHAPLDSVLSSSSASAPPPSFLRRMFDKR